MAGKLLPEGDSRVSAPPPETVIFAAVVRDQLLSPGERQEVFEAVATHLLQLHDLNLPLGALDLVADLCGQCLDLAADSILQGQQPEWDDLLT